MTLATTMRRGSRFDIIQFVDSIPGTEIAMIGAAAEIAFATTPPRRAAAVPNTAHVSVREANSAARPNSINASAVAAAPPFGPTRGSVAVENITYNGKPRRRITGEFFWDSSTDMSGFLPDDAYEHQVVFGVNGWKMKSIRH